MAGLVFIRGGGDLASGAALRLHRVGIRVVVAELPRPLVVRRLVAFAQAVFTGSTTVEEVGARLIDGPEAAASVARAGEIPVLIDPKAESLNFYKPLVIVDGRMLKQAPDLGIEAAPLVIGLGPGFSAGSNCHAVIETRRGHSLGRVIWEGEGEADTGVPDGVSGWFDGQLNADDATANRVLRSPVDGVFYASAEIGDHLEPGQPVGSVDGQVISAPFAGVLRGVLYPGLPVVRGLKIGDLDQRDDPRYCTLVSDKSLAVGGGVLEAILSRPEIRGRLWEQE